MAHLSRRVIEENRTGNLHFFVNSVEFIGSVIRKAGLKPEQVRVVCSNSGESALKNARKLGKDYPIELPSDPVKKVNFYTSTAFEGCDIYDEVGRIYIVSDASKAQTLLDISTLFIQICGRIRNTIYSKDITHIFSATRYSNDVTLEEFMKMTDKNLSEAVKLAEDINNVPEDSRRIILGKIPYLNEKYVCIENNRLMVDKNLANVDIVNFKITKQIYKTVITLSDELKRNGFGVSVKHVNFESPAEQVEMNPKAKISFKDFFNEYAILRSEQVSFSFENKHYKITLIESINPLIKEAYEKLGCAEVERLQYNQTNIRRELVKQLDIATENKIVELINDTLPHHKGIPIATVKEKLQGIYNLLGLKRNAKSTDLKNWYEINVITKTINGKSTACITIIRDKFLRV